MLKKKKRNKVKKKKKMEEIFKNFVMFLYVRVWRIQTETSEYEMPDLKR